MHGSSVAFMQRACRHVPYTSGCICKAHLFSKTCWPVCVEHCAHGAWSADCPPVVRARAARCFCLRSRAACVRVRACVCARVPVCVRVARA
eukprot:1449407-Alexandrium_andersonii.AAC.1